jgi:hypothetical protein
MRRQSDKAYDGRYVSYQGSDQSDYRHLINRIADVSGVVGVKGPLHKEELLAFFTLF